ncbi:MAG TPA: GAF domain-containing protein [Gemmatimonadales bacterium]|nr:GAF domain-containing protein [Gemmatimonadales bacterium]
MDTISTATPGATPAEDSADPLRGEIERLRLIQQISNQFNSSLDFDALVPEVFQTALTTLGAEGGSLWVADGDVLTCRLAVGGASQRMIGAQMPVGTGFIGDVAQRQRTTVVTQAIQDPRYDPKVDTTEHGHVGTVMATAMVAQGQTVGALQVTNKLTGTGVFDAGDRELFEGLAASAAIALRNAQLHTAERRARDLALLLEISREITATLDLDRVLRSVVNLAARALPFDRGAVALYQDGRCEVRAVAGQEQVDPKDPRLQDLAVRAAWAAGRGEPFYLSDRTAPTSDAERTFLTIFGADLESDEVTSGLYLPLKDEEGIVGILLFEAATARFANDTQRELATILANQTTVALRNAQLYAQVPMVDAFTAIAERRRKLLAIPERRRAAAAAVAVLILAALTLIRWPLRVTGNAPVFRSTQHTEVRAMVPGIVDRVLVTEGTAVGRGAPVAVLRDAELRAQRDAAAAAAAESERSAAQAAARNDAGEERRQRIRFTSYRTLANVLDERLAATIIRSPSAGIVLTARPEERVGGRLDAGDLVVTVGRTDTLELEFGVDQRDVARVSEGQEVRLRVDALPQRTFSGRVSSIGRLPLDTSDGVRFPVRAMVPNPDGLLRPGMAAHARVLTAPGSTAGRALREPIRQARLLWWRLWS